MGMPARSTIIFTLSMEHHLSPSGSSKGSQMIDIGLDKLDTPVGHKSVEVEQALIKSGCDSTPAYHYLAGMM